LPLTMCLCYGRPRLDARGARVGERMRVREAMTEERSGRVALVQVAKEAIWVSEDRPGHGIRVPL
jgi:hypothetical protein